jgi:hypothetical protein
MSFGKRPSCVRAQSGTERRPRTPEPELMPGLTQNYLVNPDENGQPQKCLERPAYFQIVPELPWLRKIGN